MMKGAVYIASSLCSTWSLVVEKLDVVATNPSGYKANDLKEPTQNQLSLIPPYVKFQILQVTFTNKRLSGMTFDTHKHK